MGIFNYTSSYSPLSREDFFTKPICFSSLVVFVALIPFLLISSAQFMPKTERNVPDKFHQRYIQCTSSDAMFWLQNMFITYYSSQLLFCCRTAYVFYPTSYTWSVLLACSTLCLFFICLCYFNWIQFSTLWWMLPFALPVIIIPEYISVFSHTSSRSSRKHWVELGLG